MAERYVNYGYAAVDSGRLMVVDPCYVLHSTSHHPGGNARRPTLEDWLNSGMKNANELLEHREFANGVEFTTQIGDGVYLVRGVYDDSNDLLRIEILIFQDHDEGDQ